MSGIEKAYYQAIIDKKAEEFLSSMKMFVSVGRGRFYGQDIWGLPALKKTNNRLFYEQVYYDELIENYVWRILLNGVLKDLFSEEYCQNNSVEIKWGYIHPQIATGRVEYIERMIRFEFSINRAGVKIGYRYTNPHLLDEEKAQKWFEDSDVSEMVVLDFKDDESYLPPWKKWIATKLQDKIHVVAFQDFFQEYFGCDAYIYYRDRVQSSIYEIYRHIGLQTIPNLNSQYRAPFINSMNDEISNWTINEDKYIIYDKHITQEKKVLENPGCYIIFDKEKIPDKEKKILDNPNYNISEADFRLIRNTFLSQRRYLALGGDEDFAKSFVTSEYLSDTMLSNNKFEFTAIVTGYLKSVEQLLYKLVMFTLEENPQNELWMKAKPKLPRNVRSECETIDGTNHLPFTERNLPYFDTTFKSLVNLLRQNTKGWIVSEGALQKITAYLNTYCQECRNEHFHIDNIDDPNEVNAIKYNTYFLMFLLLGGYRLDEDETKNKEILGVVDKSFDSLYIHIMSKYGIGHFYRIHFKNKAPVLAALPMTQDNPEYDDSGKLINTNIRFVIATDDEFRNPDIADWRRYESDYTPQDVLLITDENMPEEIYLINRDNVEIPVLWDHY